MKQHRNRKHARPRRLVACLVASTVCGIAHLEETLAQQPERVTIDAARCRALQSPEERLACFEAEADAARSAPPPVGTSASAPANTPPQGSQPPIPTVDVSGLPREDAPADAPGQTEWVGSITGLRQREPNQFVISLDSGQVWQQLESKRYPLRVGQRVRIEQSRFGMRLQADGVNGFIHVTRVR